MNHCHSSCIQTNYEPYGIRFGGNGTSVTMYTGKRKDEESDLFYFGTRYYDEKIGRFVTLDTAAPEYEIP